MELMEDSEDIETGYSKPELQEIEEAKEEDADAVTLTWKTLFNLPFQPIWYYSILVIATIQIYLSIYQAGFKIYGKEDGLINSDFIGLKYLSRIMYTVDIFLIIGTKHLHGLEISPLLVRRPNWVLLADGISIMPVELFIPMNPLTLLKAKLYYVLHLINLFKVARIYNTFYHARNIVGTSKIYLQVFEYYFSIGLAVMFGLVLTYQIICLDYGCKDIISLEDYLLYLYISISRITARGLTRYPENIYWLFSISIMGLIVFTAIISTSIAYVAIALYTLLYHKYEFFNKLKLISREFKVLKVPEDIAQNCMEFFAMFWNKRAGYDDDVSYFTTLPQAMYEEITLDVNWYALKHSKLLRNMDIPFLRHVSIFVKSKFALPGEIVYDKTTTKNMMVYVVSGVIQILSQEDDETPILSFSAGTCLGESSLVLNYKPKGIVRCKTFCRLHILETKQFLRLIKIFPQHFFKLRMEFKERLRRSKEYHELSKLIKQQHGIKERTDYVTILWLKSTLHRLMMEEGASASLHQFQNIFLRGEFNEEKFLNRHFSAKCLDMLAISETLELVSDTVFLKNSCPCIFKPDSIILNAWEIIIVFLAIITAFLVPYFAFVEPATPLWYEVFINILTIFWVLDLYVQISTAVKTHYEIKATVKRIFLHRMSTVPFLIDLATSLPLEFLSSIILSKVTPQYRALLYLNRAIKIWKVQKIFTKWENKLHANLLLIRYIKYCSILGFTAFICAYATYATNCFDYVCIFNTDTSIFEQLVWCLEVSVSILTGVCIQSNITTKKMYYHIYLWINLLSTIFYVYFYGWLAAEYALKRVNRIRLSDLLSDLCGIIKASKLGYKYNKRILNYVETQWTDNSAAVLLNKESIFADLPPRLYEALREQTHMEIIVNTALFQDLPEEALLDICTLVCDVILPPNEVVCYKGDICNTLFIISKGYCRVDSDIQKEEQKILGPKETIPVLEVCLRVPSVNTIITITHCKLVTIDLQALNETYTKYPLHKEELLKSLDEVNAKSQLELLYQSNYSGKYAVLTEDEDIKSFHQFSRNIQVDSFEEYDYYIPFDRLGLLSFLQYFLSRRTVLPESKFIFVWEIFRCVFAILSAILFPINTIGTCVNCRWYFLLAILDGMAWLDIYVRLHICYYNKNGILISHPLKTAIYYLKHGFLLDLLAVFPVHFIVSSNLYSETLSLLQLNRVLQIYRYVGFVNYIEEKTLLPSTVFSLLKYFPLILILCTSTGSAMINVICTFGQKVEASESFTKGVTCTNTSWITRSRFQKPLSPSRVQAYAIYFTTSILSMAGMMGFKVNALMDGFVSIMLSMIAYIMSAHIVCKAIAQCTIADSTLLTYQSSMTSVLNFMSEHKVRGELQNQLLAHYELKWQRNQGRNVKLSISRFNRSLQQDILFDIYGRTLQEAAIFITDSKAFLCNLLLEVSHDVNMKSTFITAVNDVTKYLHILYKGRADVIASDGSKIASLTPGSIFGNLDNYDMVRQMVSVVAVGHVEVLSIDALRFHAILSHYPKLQNRYKYLTSMHVDYIEGRGRVAAEDELTCATYSSLITRLSSSKNPLVAINNKVFNPESIFMRIWKVIILIGVCYIEVFFELYQLATAEYSISFIVIQYICDLLYIINYFVITHTAVENDVGLIVKDFALINQRFRQNRFYFWFVIVGMIPFDIFVWFAPPTVFRILYPTLRLNRLLRFNHVIRRFQRQKQKLDLKLYVWRFTYILLWSTFTLHFCTCILITLGCIYSPNIHPEITCDISTPSSEKFVIYARIYYVVISCFLRASEAISYPQSLILTIYIIFLMIFLLHINAIFITQIYTTLQMGYNRLNVFAQKLERIRNYMQREQLSEPLYVKAYEYLKFLWTQNKGTIFPRLLDGAPTHIRESILNSAFGLHINHHFVFRECHIDFNRQLAACLRNKTYFKDDYIVLKGTINRSMYFVHTGKVLVVVDADSLNETIIETLNPGMSFGITQGLFPEKNYSYTFRAASKSIVLCLYWDMWKHLLRFFPATKATIYNRYALYGDKYA